MAVYDIIKELGIKTCWCSVYGEVHVICMKDIRYIDLLLKEKGNVVMRLDEDGKLEDRGECLIFPSKENRDWNSLLEETNKQLLPINTPVMVTITGNDWALRYYRVDRLCAIFKKDKKCYSYKYIVPVSKFDFEADDLSINLKKSI